MAGQCESDFDCADNEMCYTGVSWFETGGYGGNGCLCNTWYAWTGPNCDEYSATSVGLILWNLLTMCVGIATCVVLVRCALIYRATRKRLCRYTVTTAAIFFAFLSTLGASMWAFVQLMSTALVSGPPIADYEGTRDIYKGRWNILANVFGPLGTFFAALALLQISLMWIEVSVRSGQLSVQSRNQLVYTRKLVYLFQVLAVLFGTAGAVVEKSLLQNVMGFFILPLVLAVMYTYVSGAVQLTHILNASAANRSKWLAGSKHDPHSDDMSVGAASGSVVGPPPATPGAAAAAALRDAPPSPEPLGRVKKSAKKLLKTVRSFGSAGSRDAADDHLQPHQLSAPLVRGGSGASAASAASTAGGSGSTPFVAILRRIRNTSVMVCLCLALFESMYLALSITDAVWARGWKELAPPDQFFTIKAVHNLLMSSIVLSQVVVAWYILRSLQNTAKHAQLAARK